MHKLKKELKNLILLYIYNYIGINKLQTQYAFTFVPRLH